jgi:hypothetical protein
MRLLLPGAVVERSGDTTGTHLFPILMLLYWDAHPVWAVILGGVGLLLLGVTWWYFGRAVPRVAASTVTPGEMLRRDDVT